MSESTWDKARLQALLLSNDKAVARAVHLVYKNQTASERAIGATVEDNGVGFTGVDGGILSSYAKFYEKAGFLTVKQIAVARKKIVKYWRQILKDMESRGYDVSFKG